MTKLDMLKITLGDLYFYEKYIDEKEVSHLLLQKHKIFTDRLISSLTIGCVKIEAVIYYTKSAPVLGYDIFVKDNPDSSEWICYDNIPAQFSTKDSEMEQEMFCVLDEIMESNGLSYTDCSFETILGKTKIIPKPEND